MALHTTGGALSVVAVPLVAWKSFASFMPSAAPPVCEFGRSVKK
jgi:hypothetical protein